MANNILDIASACGVSHATVSRILNGKGQRHSAATIAKVEATAAKMGYRPNAYAVDMQRQTFSCVGLLHDAQPQRSSLPQTLMAGLADALQEHDMHLTFARLPDKAIEESGLPKMLRKMMCDALLLNYHGALPPEVENRIASTGLPTVWLNSKREHNAVYPNEYAGARLAVEHMLERGHRRIAFTRMAYPDKAQSELHYSLIDRQQGFVDAMAAAGFEGEVIHLHGKEAQTHMRARLSQDDAPTAILAYGSDSTHVQMAATHLHMELGRDLSLMSFMYDTSWNTLSISAIRNPWNTVGKAAVSMLMDAHGQDAIDSVAVTPELFEGSTVAQITP